MSDHNQLRDEYLQRVCSALGEYLDRGLPLHLHSDGDAEALSITFTIDLPDTFHAILEDRPVPVGACASDEGAPGDN